MLHIYERVKGFDLCAIHPPLTMCTVGRETASGGARARVRSVHITPKTLTEKFFISSRRAH